MRTRLFVTAALLAAAATVSAMQDPSKDPKKKTSDKAVITVTGCVDGGWLHVHEVDPVGSYTERYRLHGPKQLMKEIASQHNRHLLEVTGKVTDTRDTTHMGQTIQAGKKTRIYTGAKDVPTVPNGDDPTLDVQTYREMKETCR
jgi:hypothetical protein